ncbi:hypothetical protein HYT00_00195 [Candidatus Giovannonibacteria bacterium]|nr:hypothetical protein [Candidatus Giovannonibacteria bacterium]
MNKKNKKAVIVDYREKRFELFVPGATSEGLREKLKEVPMFTGATIVPGVNEDKPALFVIVGDFCKPAETVEGVSRWAKTTFFVPSITFTASALAAMRSL